MVLELNIGNSIYKGLNDNNGIMICGYEWGFSKKDQGKKLKGEAQEFNAEALTIFSNKSPAHGEQAFTWRYDNRVIKWFDIWGHPLSRENLGGDFEKCIIQTNWCNTEGNYIKENYYQKLTKNDQIKNFIFHIKEFKPSLIIFMGSSIMDILQDEKVIYKFTEIMGPAKSRPKKIQKQFQGRQFKIGFQSFEKCEIISLPHPSSSRGLSDEYIELFATEISYQINKIKNRKGISNA